MKSHLSGFFKSSRLMCSLQNHCLVWGHDDLHLFSSKDFIVLALIWRNWPSLTWLLHEVGGLFSFFCIWISHCISTVCWKNCSVAVKLSWQHYPKSVFCRCVLVSVYSVLFHWSVFLSLCQLLTFEPLVSWVSKFPQGSGGLPHGNSLSPCRVTIYPSAGPAMLHYLIISSVLSRWCFIDVISTFSLFSRS